MTPLVDRLSAIRLDCARLGGMGSGRTPDAPTRDAPRGRPVASQHDAGRRAAARCLPSRRDSACSGTLDDVD